MGFKLLSLFNILSCVFGTPLPENHCRLQCEHPINVRYTNCYVTSTDCDVAFPPVSFSVDDLGFCWVYLNFTTNIVSSNYTKPNFDFKGRFWFNDIYSSGRYSFSISNIDREDFMERNEITAEISFIVRDVMSNDAGTYDLILTEGTVFNPDGVILSHRFRLLNDYSTPPIPTCRADEVENPVTTSKSGESIERFFVTCVVNDDLAAAIQLQIFSSGNCSHEAVTSPSYMDRWQTTQSAYVQNCANSLWKCSAVRRKVDLDMTPTEDSECVFDFVRSNAWPLHSLPSTTHLRAVTEFREGSSTSGKDTKMYTPPPVIITLYVLVPCLVSSILVVSFVVLCSRRRRRRRTSNDVRDDNISKTENPTVAGVTDEEGNEYDDVFDYEIF